MTDRDYIVRGCTALIDALGGAIRHIANIHKYARPEDVLEHTVFGITTDGLENASHHYDADRVKRMLEHEKVKYGWEFLFLAANIDAVSTAKRFGIHEDRAVNYLADSQGTGAIYDTVAEAVCQVRASVPLRKSWGLQIKRDFERRKKGTKRTMKNKDETILYSGDYQ